MNFKTIILATMAFASVTAQAKFLTPIHDYILDSGKVVMLQGVNESRGTAWYYDNNLNKRVKVNLSEASKETKKKINGVSVNDFVYTTTNKGPTVCITYNVFENGMAQLGCRTGKIVDYHGPERYQVAVYTGNTSNLLAPVNEADGYSKNDFALLNGEKVIIRALYNNGYALTERFYVLDILDSVSALKFRGVEVVATRDLEKL